MASSLLELMEDLLQALEQRDASDPDAPAWEARARIQRLEEEIALRLDAGAARPPIVVTGVARQSEEAATIPV